MRRFESRDRRSSGRSAIVVTVGLLLIGLGPAVAAGQACEEGQTATGPLFSLLEGQLRKAAKEATSSNAPKINGMIRALEGVKQLDAARCIPGDVYNSFVGCQRCPTESRCTESCLRTSMWLDRVTAASRNPALALPLSNFEDWCLANVPSDLECSQRATSGDTVLLNLRGEDVAKVAYPNGESATYYDVRFALTWGDLELTSWTEWVRVPGGHTHYGYLRSWTVAVAESDLALLSEQELEMLAKDKIEVEVAEPPEACCWR